MSKRATGRADAKREGKSEFSAKAYERPGLTVDEIEELKEAFDAFDHDQSGSIVVADLLKSMRSQGFDTKNPAVYNMIADMNVDSGLLHFDEFLDLMTSRISEKNPRADLERVFKLFDDQRQGFISTANIARVAAELGEDISAEEMKDMIERGDLDGDGKLGFDDFYAIMMKKSFA